MAINGMGQLTDSILSVPLGVLNRVPDEVTLHFELGLFRSGHAIYLEDKATGNLVDVRESPDYVYTPLAVGPQDDRFILHVVLISTSLTDPLHDKPDSAGIVITGKSGSALVKVPAGTMPHDGLVISVYTLQGQHVVAVRSKTPGTVVDLPRRQAVFVVRGQCGNTVQSARVVGLSNE